jgi:two-component system alkaline phosphatase synthesis response regulator PhoP
MSKTIMVVDSERRLLSLIESCLTLEGYQVLTARNGEEALSVARLENPDMIILDVMMSSEMDCCEFIRAYRRERPLPILLLMARVEDTQQVISLEVGANDYIIKPFRPRELMARIRAAFRRAGDVELPARVLKAAGVTLDKGNRFVKIGQRYVDLTPSEFDLLAVLMSAPGRVISRPDLLEVLRGVRCEGNNRLIDLHIKNLRAKIEANPRSPQYIETVYGFGYRFSRQ